jgi:drug/metabolite transporter (DMT)-like permease
LGILYGLVAAVLYGSGDYLGGRATADGDVRRVLLISQSTAALGAAVLVFVVHGDVDSSSLGYGAAAGVASALGLGLLYRGLAVGRAGVVAPITAVVGALVPVIWGVTRGERPSAIASTGVAIAIVAAALVAREHDEATGRPPGIGLALAAGAVLGSSFVFYALTNENSGMWPILSARIVAVACAALTLLVSTRQEKLDSSTQERGWWPLAVGAGVADVVATVSLVAGVRAELAVLVAAVTALAPGFTVMWSWTLLKEHVGRDQLIGVALALIGLVAIAAG